MLALRGRASVSLSRSPGYLWNPKAALALPLLGHCLGGVLLRQILAHPTHSRTGWGGLSGRGGPAHQATPGAALSWPPSSCIPSLGPSNSSLPSASPPCSLRGAPGRILGLGACRAGGSPERGQRLHERPGPQGAEDPGQRACEQTVSHSEPSSIKESGSWLSQAGQPPWHPGQGWVLQQTPGRPPSSCPLCLCRKPKDDGQSTGLRTWARVLRPMTTPTARSTSGWCCSPGN